MLDLPSLDVFKETYEGFDIDFNGKKPRLQCRKCNETFDDTPTCTCNCEVYLYEVRFSISKNTDPVLFRRTFIKDGLPMANRYKYKVYHDQLEPLKDLAQHAAEIRKLEVDKYRQCGIKWIDMEAKYDNIYVWASVGFMMSNDVQLAEIAMLFSDYIDSISAHIKDEHKEKIKNIAEHIVMDAKDKKQLSIKNIYSAIKQFNLNDLSAFPTFGNYINKQYDKTIKLYQSI
ncbi:MAG: hypothetical protein LBV09_01970 [Deferribacteraceae bacterium]|jgi:hypothetical protein|nr:hypothetical protein [Deferribacteraceae bacterium]